jgi:hypothetical protein
MSTETIEWSTEDENGSEIVHELPARLEVCPRCRGKGSHVNPSIDGHGITQEERERDWSDDEWDGYLRGDYDVNCYECDGLRVVAVVDRDSCDPDLLKQYDQDQAEEAAFQRMCQAERDMGA